MEGPRAARPPDCWGPVVTGAVIVAEIFLWAADADAWAALAFSDPLDLDAFEGLVRVAASPGRAA